MEICEPTRLQGAKPCPGRITGNPKVMSRTACKVGFSVTSRPGQWLAHGNLPGNPAFEE